VRAARAFAAAALLAVVGCRRPRHPARPAVATDVPVDLGPPPLVLETPPPAGPPRMFRFDARHTGRSGYRLPRHPAITARFATGGRITSQPVVSTRGAIVVTSHDGGVYGLARDGSAHWRVNTGDRVYTTPVVRADGTMVLGTDADRVVMLGADGSLRLALGTDDDADTSAAAAGDGSLRFGAGRSLYATEADLTVRWRLVLGAKVYSSPAVGDDGVTVVGAQDDRVRAIDPDGGVRWTVVTRDDVDAPPAIGDDGTVYVGGDDGVLRAISRDGAERWQRPLGGYVRAGVALGLDGALVVGTYGPRARVVAVDRESGAVRWERAVVGPPTRDYGVASSALVDVDGSYAVGVPDDALWLLDREGALLARVALPGDVDSSPALIDDGLLVVGCDDGVVYFIGDGSVDGGTP
jgi:outer membrane protein assembly factor BamB